MGVRNYRDVPRMYFDFDGTLGDFIGAAAANGMTPTQYKRVAGAYRHLKLLAGAAEAIDRAEALGLDPWGLTKIPGVNPYAATEKLLWTQELLPKLHDKVIITPDKGAVGTPRDVLVDDMPSWANAQNFPGTLIHFKGDWDAVFKIVMAKMGLVDA